MKPQPVEQEPLRSETAGEMTVTRRPRAFDAVAPLFGATIIWQKREVIWILADAAIVLQVSSTSQRIRDGYGAVAQASLGC